MREHVPCVIHRQKDGALLADDDDDTVAEGQTFANENYDKLCVLPRSHLVYLKEVTRRVKATFKCVGLWLLSTYLYKHTHTQR